MSTNVNSLSVIRALLIDLSGTIHVGDRPIAGAVDAVNALNAAGVHYKFVTNTSKVNIPVFNIFFLE